MAVVLGASRGGFVRWFSRTLAAPFIVLRIRPTVITVLAFLLSAVPAYFASEAEWLWAALSLFLVSGLDLIDGTVARATNRVTAFGGYLDSVLDRASDLIVLLGIGLGIDTRTGWLLIGVCLLTTFLTSYARARAYQDTVPPPAVWNQVFERPERILFLTLALTATGLSGRFRPEIDLLPWLLLIYAVLGLWTVLARVYKVRGMLEQTRK